MKAKTSIPNISLCMIVKDELANLGRNLSPLVKSFPEVIVVDTGSTDGTKEYLALLPHHVRVIEFNWVDDFSAARNQYLKVATRPWIYWMDADEYLDPAYVSILEKCSKKGKKNAWAYRYQPGMTTFQIKLFPRLPGVKYVMRCHEQIYPSLMTAGIRKIRFFPEPFKIVNPSYAEAPQESSVRNIKLLKLDIQEQPNYLMSYVRLAYEYCNLGRYDDGIAVLDSMVSKKSAVLSGEDRQARSLGIAARQTITLQKRLHKKMEEGESPTQEELQELIRLGGIR
jgi:glycosyltransferase involved in cell wall biosynthesis